MALIGLFDLRRVIPNTPWLGPRLLLLRDVDALEFWKALPAWELDEIECVYQYLHDIDKGSSEVLNALDSTHWHNQLQQLPAAPAKTMEGWSVSGWEVKSPQNLMSESKNIALRPSPGFGFFRTLESLGARSPLQDVDFRGFRRIGFGIWSMKRLCGMRVCNWPPKVLPPQNGLCYQLGVDEWMSIDNILYTWRSIQSNIARYQWSR